MIPLLITKKDTAIIRWKKYFEKNEFIVSWESREDNGGFNKIFGVFSQLDDGVQLVRHLGFGGYKVNVIPNCSSYNFKKFHDCYDHETGTKDWYQVYRNKVQWSYLYS